ncbi:MAG: uracil-DNA glycosylase [Chloroflexi bacterium]|nr:uracil-DNA glycosylase [Chloroflexi bacterium CFX1]MCK6568766.1 uracil-DNA glycosylase [Anaerolineales bacterium]MCQ3952239.1 uracil-DNA glycosylase [Chloroflexota bacterium]MDL1920140.1 uracil-DNA glycosylase [Chloroflexi bacterium CFX5]NUQ60084.1 uracil-DNA glycosylase [Anaerolineales bacterium]
MPARILARIAGEIAVCKKCALCESRKRAVAGEGPADAEILFIGEGPGFHEDEQGRPFVGASGRFLDQLLEQAGLKRADVFIANVVKCRPPGNRDPRPDELEACREYLNAQIEAINPSIIVTLGRVSMGGYFPGAKITSIHGRMQKIDGRFIIPMFHPAAALHQPALRPSILADFANLPGQLNEARAALGRRPVERKTNTANRKAETPRQLSLF